MVPQEFPPPPDATDYDELIASSEDIHVQWESGLAVSDAIDFYDRMLPERGWEVTSRRQGGDSTRYRIEGHGWVGAVTLLGGDPVKVVLQLGLPDDA